MTVSPETFASMGPVPDSSSTVSPDIFAMTVSPEMATVATTVSPDILAMMGPVPLSSSTVCPDTRTTAPDAIETSSLPSAVCKAAICSLPRIKTTFFPV